MGVSCLLWVLSLVLRYRLDTGHWLVVGVSAVSCDQPADHLTSSVQCCGDQQTAAAAGQPRLAADTGVTGAVQPCWRPGQLLQPWPPQVRHETPPPAQYWSCSQGFSPISEEAAASVNIGVRCGEIHYYQSAARATLSPINIYLITKAPIVNFPRRLI